MRDQAFARIRGWASSWREAAGLWLASRGGLVVVALFASATTISLTGHERAVDLHTLLLRTQMSDGRHYVHIAARGYAQPGEAAWFPLWPLLLRAATLGTTDTTALALAGLLLAALAALAACAGLAALAAEIRPGWDPSIPVQLLLASPVAFFLAAPYSEALYLALSVWALYALRRRAFVRAALLCAFATAARPVGVALSAALAYELWQTGLWRRWLSAVALVALSASGLLAYAAFCAVRWGDPLAFAHVAVSPLHGHALLWPWQTLALTVQQLAGAPVGSWEQLHQLFDDGAVLATFALLVVGARRLPRALTLYGVLAALPVLLMPIPMPALPGPLVSGARYMLVIVPAWLTLAAVLERHPQARWLLVAGGAMLQALLLSFELQHGWLP